MIARFPKKNESAPKARDKRMNQHPSFIVEDRYLEKSVLSETFHALTGMCFDLPAWEFGDALTRLRNTLSSTQERSLMHAALLCLGSDLSIVVAIAQDSLNACSAKRRAAFVSICQMAAGKLEGSSVSKTLEERVDMMLFRAFDEFKEQVFRVVFLTPTAHYFRCVGNHVMEGDVWVHGINTYAALLHAYSPVRTSHMPLLEDETKGICDFLSVRDFIPHVEKLWHLENFARGVSCSQILPDRGYGTSFISLHHQRSVDMLLLKLAPTSATPQQRQQLQRYITQFHSYFGNPSFLLKWMFQRLCNDELNFQDLCESARKHGLIQQGDVRAWIWNMEEEEEEEEQEEEEGEEAKGGGDGQFNLKRAICLFQALGFVKKQVTPSQLLPYTHAPVPLDRLTFQDDDNGDDGGHKDIPEGARIPRHIMSLSVAGDIGGGGTGREFASNLFNDSKEPWDKWVHPGHITRSWIQVEMREPCILKAYSLCSANDYPTRDPTQWHLVVELAESRASLVVSRVEAAIFTRRWEYKYMRIDPPCLVSRVTLFIDGVAGFGDGIQLGHFHLEGHVAEQNPRNRSEQQAPTTLLLGPSQIMWMAILFALLALRISFY